MCFFIIFADSSHKFPVKLEKYGSFFPFFVAKFPFFVEKSPVLQMTNPWEVSDAEYQKNFAMFGQLTGGQPFMDAVTARNALMRSNLPTQVLSQVDIKL